MKRLVRFSVCACLGLTAGLARNEAASATAPKPRVVIYGDSLIQEAAPYIAAGFDQNKVDLVWRYYGGSALCQWLPSMAAEAQTPTTAVLIQFVGNSFDVNNCMNDPATGQAWPVGSQGWLDKYTADAQTAQNTWDLAGVPVYWVQNPPLPTVVANSTIDTDPLNLLYADLGANFVPAGATVADANGAFTYWKDCLPGEQCGVGASEPPPGQNQVRNADQVHFCPDSWTGTCTYSPGAFRFGSAAAAAVASKFAFSPEPAGAPSAPSAPTGVFATAGNTEAQVTWTAPSDDGGSPVTGYTVTPYIGSVAQPARRFDSTATTESTTESITGLTNGTSYTFTVAATNGIGTGPESLASNSISPK